MKKLVFLIIALLIIALPLNVFAQPTNKDIIETESGDATETREERLALIIGINDYLNVPDLKFAEKDALLVKEILEEQGVFKTIFIGSNTSKSPTKYNIFEVLDNIAESSELGITKTFVLYFSGHGFNVGGKNYLAPMEIDPSNIASTGIELEEVLEAVKTIQNNAKVMMFIDACRNTPKGVKSIGSEETDGWNDNDSKGMKALYSTSAGEVSYELPELEHGIYTLHLSQALKGLADLKPFGNENGYVSFAEVAKYVAMKMSEFSSSNPYNIKQTPRIEMQEAIGDFNLTKSDSIEVKVFEDYEEALVISEGVSYTEEYKILIESLYKKLQEDLENKDFNKAINDSNSILDIMETYEGQMDLKDDKRKLEILKNKLILTEEAILAIKEGNNHFREYNTKKAEDSYGKAFLKISGNGLEDFIGNFTDIHKYYRILMNISKIINKGDEELKSAQKSSAKSLYENAQLLIESTNIDELMPNTIPSDFIPKRLSVMDSVLSLMELFNQAQDSYANKEYVDANNYYKKFLNSASDIEKAILEEEITLIKQNMKFVENNIYSFNNIVSLYFHVSIYNFTVDLLLYYRIRLNFRINQIMSMGLKFDFSPGCVYFPFNFTIGLTSQFLFINTLNSYRMKNPFLKHQFGLSFDFALHISPFGYFIPDTSEEDYSSVIVCANIRFGPEYILTFSKYIGLFIHFGIDLNLISSSKYEDDPDYLRVLEPSTLAIFNLSLGFVINFPKKD